MLDILPKETMALSLSNPSAPPARGRGTIPERRRASPAISATAMSNMREKALDQVKIVSRDTHRKREERGGWGTARGTRS